MPGTRDGSGRPRGDGRSVAWHAGRRKLAKGIAWAMDAELSLSDEPHGEHFADRIQDVLHDTLDELAPGWRGEDPMTTTAHVTPEGAAYLPRFGVILSRLQTLCLLAAADAEDAGEEITGETIARRVGEPCTHSLAAVHRHGFTHWSGDPGGGDFHRALTDNGREAVRAIREAMAERETP